MGTNPKVTSKYFNDPSSSRNSGMDESLSEFKEEKKSSKGPKEVKIQRKPTQKPRKRIRGQKDIRTALKPKKNELLTYANNFDKVCKQSGIDIDSEQLQLAIALSKSLETENAEPSTSSQSRDRTGKIRKTLQEYGFKVPEKQITKRRVKRYRKDYKLLLTSIEEKQQIISDRYSQVLFRNIERVTPERPKSTKLDLFCLATEISYDLIKNSNFFYIKNLIEQHPNSVGSLLKSWSIIPGRPKSPILKKTEVKFRDLDFTQENLDVILSGTLNTTQETVISLSKVSPEEVNRLDKDICYKSVERTSNISIDTKMDTEHVIISLEDDENCEELCSFEPMTEKVKPESPVKIDHVNQNDPIMMKNDQRCSSPDLFDDELSVVENAEENSVIVSQVIKLTEASNNFMDLTDCVAAKSRLNIDQSQIISQKNNFTKRKSDDFMEITDCVAGSSQPLLDNIVEVNIDLTQNSDEHCQENIVQAISTVTVKHNEIMDLTQVSNSNKTSSNKNNEIANKDIESLDLTQSSNSEDELPIVQISGRQVNEDGRQVNADGLKVNEDGRQVNEDDQQVNEDGLKVNEDGRQSNENSGQQVNKESSLSDTIILNDDEYKCSYAPNMMLLVNDATRNNTLNFEDKSVELVCESFTEIDTSNMNKIDNSENFHSAIYEPKYTMPENEPKTHKTKAKIISREYSADCKVSRDYLADCKASKEKLQRNSTCKSKTESFFDEFDYTHSDEDLKRQSANVSKENTPDSSNSKSSNLDIGSIEQLEKEKTSNIITDMDLTESYTDVKISRKKILDIVNDIDLTQSSNDEEQYSDESPRVSYESPRVSCESLKVTCESPKVSCEIPQVSCQSPQVACKSPQVTYEGPRVSRESPQMSYESLEKSPQMSCESLGKSSSPQVQVSYESLGKRNNVSIDYDGIFDNVIEQHSLDSKQNSFYSKSTIENAKIDICDSKNLERSNSIVSSCSQNSEVFEISDNEFNYSVNQSRYERPDENYEIPEENYEMSQENYEMSEKNYEMPEENYEMPENFDFGGISIMDDLSNARSSKSMRKSKENHEIFRRKEDKLNSAVNDSKNDSFLPIIDVGYSKNKPIPTENVSSNFNSKVPYKMTSKANNVIETPSNAKYIIKTDQVTPMLDFGSMTTPERNKELDRYGLKPFKRKRAIQLLTHLYNQTHPIVASCSEDNMPSPSKKQKPNSFETLQEQPQKSPRKFLSQNSPKKKESGQKSPRKCLSQNVLRKSPKKKVGISPIKFESRGESTNSDDYFSCTENRISHPKKLSPRKSPRKCRPQNLQQKSPKKKVGISPIKFESRGESSTNTDDNFSCTENRISHPKKLSPRKSPRKCRPQNLQQKSPKKKVGISPIKFESRGESSTNTDDNFSCTENRISHPKKLSPRKSPRKCRPQNLQQKSPKRKVGLSPIKSAKIGESTSNSDDNFLYTENRQNLPKSPRKKTAKSGENSPKSCDNFDSENLYEVTNEQPVIKVVYCNEDDWVFQKKEKAKVQSCRVPLHIAFHNYVSARPRLREAILRYEPVNIDDIHKGLLANGLRFDPKDLLKFLDKQCITVKTADNDSDKRT